MRLPLVILVALAAVALLAQTPLIDQGRAAIGRGDTAAAVDILEKAVAQSPNSPEAHFYLANAYLGQGEKAGMLGAPRYASKAKDELEKAVALGDLSRAGILTAMSHAGTLSFDGLTGDYHFGSPADRDPPRQSTVFKVNPAVPAGLTKVKGPFISDGARAFSNFAPS